MPNSKGTGGKRKHKRKNGSRDGKRQLILKEAEGQEYAQVLKCLGNCRVTAYCFDGVERLCHIRGNLRTRIQKEDIILVCLRDFQDKKADIIYRYSPNEARTLKEIGQLPGRALIEVADISEETDVGGEKVVLHQNPLDWDDLLSSSDSELESDSYEGN
mmetsp:Transcript_128579/g.191575  ORF Transcript_128579/g.191575 Transcript_128579/m.191575 type:complete len:159 (+) Transcript_128579:20-496(+)